jgi:hypothetical protein
MLGEWWTRHRTAFLSAFVGFAATCAIKLASFL